jgi:hypothetical protein
VSKNKDTDDFNVALLLRTLPFAVIAALLAFTAGVMMGASLLATALATLGAGAAGIIVPLLLVEQAGRAGSTIYHSRGTSTPPIAQYSLADSLAARGMLAEAAEAYELLSQDFPLDPEPRIRLARLLRDRMQRADDAAMWFRSTLMMPGIESATEISVLRELCELYTHKLKTPDKALPWLSRLAQKYPQHPGGTWARAEMADIRETMRNRND